MSITRVFLVFVTALFFCVSSVPMNKEGVGEALEQITATNGNDQVALNKPLAETKPESSGLNSTIYNTSQPVQQAESDEYTCGDCCFVATCWPFAATLCCCMLSMFFCPCCKVRVK